MIPTIDKKVAVAGLLGTLGIAYFGGKSISTSSLLPGNGAAVAVHVSGQVKKPGLVTVPATARVNDAIQAAGGASAEADPDQLNLAASVRDGEKIYVPAQGETVPASPQNPARKTDSMQSFSTKPQSNVVGKISLNTASSVELEQLPGVGPATAAKILEYRSSRGSFKSIEEIQEVKGIGPKKFEKMRPFLAL